MNPIPWSRRLPPLFRKDLLYVRWYAGVAWAAAAASQLGRLPGAGSLRSLPDYTLPPLTFICYLGILASTTLDCPWSGNSFARGKPVGSGILYCAKLLVLIVALGIPLLAIPVTAGTASGDFGSKAVIYFTMLLLGMHATVPFSRSTFALLAHGVLFVALLNVVGFRAIPVPRFEHPAFLGLWDLWLAGGLLAAASLRHRWQGLLCSVVVVGVFAVGGFTLHRF